MKYPLVSGKCRRINIIKAVTQKCRNYSKTTNFAFLVHNIFKNFAYFTQKNTQCLTSVIIQIYRLYKLIQFLLCRVVIKDKHIVPILYNCRFFKNVRDCHLIIKKWKFLFIPVFQAFCLQTIVQKSKYQRNQFLVFSRYLHKKQYEN